MPIKKTTPPNKIILELDGGHVEFENLGMLADVFYCVPKEDIVTAIREALSVNSVSEKSKQILMPLSQAIEKLSATPVVHLIVDDQSENS